MFNDSVSTTRATNRFLLKLSTLQDEMFRDGFNNFRQESEKLKAACSADQHSLKKPIVDKVEITKK